MTASAGARVLDAVRDLLPGLRERADEAERLRQVPEQSIKELEETGFFRMLQPRSVGGLETTPVEFFSAVREIASADGSTGWVSSVVGFNPWQVALFPDEVQAAVWGSDPDVRLCSSHAPTGRARRTDGGHVLSGSWSFSSGSAHCDWVLLGALVLDDRADAGDTATSGVVDFRTFLLPRADYRIVDVWNAVGLRGTGSNDVVVDEVFVPDAWSLSMGDLDQCRVPGQGVNPGPLYRLPFHSLFTSTITAPIVGIAAGAYAEHVRLQRDRVRVAYPGSRADSDPFTAVRIARTGSEIDAAWTLLLDNLRQEWQHVERGEPIPLRLRLRLRRDQVLGTQRAIDAVDTLFGASGSRALAEGTHLQRAWRDAHAGRVHAANDAERALKMYGDLELGHDIEPGMY